MLHSRRTNTYWWIARLTAVNGLRVFTYVCLAVAMTGQAFGFAYVDPSESTPQRVVHPIGYSIQGGVLDITVGIAPDTPRYHDIILPLEHVITTWNELVPTMNNVIKGSQTGLSSIKFDFESVLLHEMGHSLGLGHPNVASDSGVNQSFYDYTSSFAGSNEQWDFDAGLDHVIGSSDDIRGDDINANWFRISNNDPFTIDSVVDKTTYSCDLSDLPEGDLYSANPGREIATLLGYDGGENIFSESVMQQGTYRQEIQRSLGYDDVAGIRYAMTGRDEIAGTNDDYTINLQYIGISDSADIIITFSDETSFAATSYYTERTNSLTHRKMGVAEIHFNPGILWNFTLPEGCLEADINCDGSVDLLDLVIIGENYNLSNKSHYEGDISGDGTVNLVDLVTLGDSYGYKSADIPEPTAGVMALVTLLGICRRR